MQKKDMMTQEMLQMLVQNVLMVQLSYQLGESVEEREKVC